MAQQIGVGRQCPERLVGNSVLTAEPLSERALQTGELRNMLHPDVRHLGCDLEWFLSILADLKNATKFGILADMVKT